LFFFEKVSKIMDYMKGKCCLSKFNSKINEIEYKCTIKLVNNDEVTTLNFKMQTYVDGSSSQD
jgi:hypothetical protein